MMMTMTGKDENVQQKFSFLFFSKNQEETKRQQKVIAKNIRKVKNCSDNLTSFLQT